MGPLYQTGSVSRPVAFRPRLTAGLALGLPDLSVVVLCVDLASVRCTSRFLCRLL